MSTVDDDLTTLDGIRQVFLVRFQAVATGYHALGEQVLAAYFAADDQHTRPVSAMTFRNFLQGKTTLRDPNGLLLYFEKLGATPGEMRRIRATLQQEVDRRLAAPSQHNALKAFSDGGLDAMPYSRALAEAEAATRFEESVSTPIASVSPTQYLLGPAGTRDAGPDPRNWGLLQHMRALAEFLERLEMRLQDDFATTPERDRRRRKWLAAAGVREESQAYIDYMLARPELAELIMSQRRYILQGPMPERERRAAVAAVQRVVRCLYHAYERFAQEVVLDGDKKKLARTPEGEVALESVGDRLFGISHSFHMTVVLGSTGTGAFFIASQQSRREFAHEKLRGPTCWSAEHERLIQNHERVLAEAASLLEDNARVRYGEVKALFDKEAQEARPLHRAIWQLDRAPALVRDTGVLIASEYHRRGLLSDAELIAFQKRFLTSAEGRALQDAVYEERMYELPESPSGS